jgi:hypothetical protein
MMKYSARAVLLLVLLGGCHPHRAVPSHALQHNDTDAAASAPETSSPPAVAPSPSPSIPAPGGALGDLDLLFLDAYKARRDAIKASLTPLIVVSGSSITLWRAGSQERQQGIPEEFHALKAVAHLPFALYLTLQPHATSGPIPDSVLEGLGTYGPRIAAARTHLLQYPFSGEQFQRQELIFRETESFLASVTRAGHLAGEELDHFARKLGPHMLANASDAGCLQIQKTHQQVMKWKQAIPREEWARLRVIHRAPHQARYRNAATQYFAWLLGDQDSPSWLYPGEGLRNVYAEIMFGDKPDVKDLAATVDIDAVASESFFAGPWRLSEDVLSDGAARCIAELSKELE